MAPKRSSLEVDRRLVQSSSDEQSMNDTPRLKRRRREDPTTRTLSPSRVEWARRRLPCLFRELEGRQGGLTCSPSSSTNCGYGAKPTVTVGLKSACVEYVRAMLLEIIRDGEVIESERKMMLWSMIMLAQLWDKSPNLRIAVPSCPQAINRYMETQGPTIMNFMQTVQDTKSGVRENIFEARGRVRGRAWVEGLSSASAPEDALGSALAGATRQGFGWFLRLAGNGDLVQEATAEELMIAVEPPEDFDVYEHFGWLVGACLDSLGPLAPEGYQFKPRVLDFYKLFSAKRYVDINFLMMGLRFFCASFLYTYLKRIPTFVAGALYVRVFICSFDENIWVIGRVVRGLSLLAERTTDWDRNNVWVGCPEDGSPSALQLIPDTAADIVALCTSFVGLCFISSLSAAISFSYGTCRLKSHFALAVACPVGLLGGCAARLVDWGAEGLFERTAQLTVEIALRPLLRTLVNYFFAVVLAKFLYRTLETTDELVQPKLLLMSLKLGAQARTAMTPSWDS
mmetsp:Transcript_5207/g.9764  ORF Transcript_5207/g.9764 Transcript_5207/m.9764 type:complete len:512 (+) Transcript_5207:73-1608(+)